MDCLSGVRVRLAAHGARTNLSTPKSARRGLIGARREMCYIALVGLKAREQTCATSNNSAYPIQRGIHVSRFLRSRDSRTQPPPCRVDIAGTQGNHGSDSPLAGGNKLRAAQSYLSLSRWRESLPVKLQSLQNTDRLVRPKIERTRRSEVRGSASVIQIDRSRIPGSRVPCVSLRRSPPA